MNTMFQLNQKARSANNRFVQTSNPTIEPIKKVNFTDEQLAIINTPIQGVTVVKAFAGTGKTSTLVGVAQRNSHMRGLYIAFNKAIKEEAAKKFPSSVDCKTIHSIAFRDVGFQYQHKLVANIQLKEVIHFSDIYEHDYQTGQAIMQVLLAFLASDREQFYTMERLKTSTGENINCGKLSPEIILKHAEKIWNMMINPKHKFPMVHDGYLKLFQLRKIKLNYDYLMFDEAQDSNPVTTAIVKFQKCPVIVVGDQYQNIYSFRGAFNALEKFQADVTLYLTNSFRFGNSIADISNVLLSTFFDETNELKGKGFPTIIGKVDTSIQYCVLCRTNFEVFNQCVSALERGQSFGLIGGIQNYNFDIVKEAYYFSIGTNDRIRSPELKQFESYSELCLFVDETQDPGLKRLRKLIDNYGKDIPKLIDEIKAKAQPNYLTATCIITTAHKSKGLELDQVVLADDFPDLVVTKIKNNESSTQLAEVGFDISAEEINLIYVAVTRAIKKLEINGSLNLFLSVID